MSELEKFYLEQERKEAVEHRDVLLSIASIINTDEGRKLFRYLFKTLDVTELPTVGMEGNALYEYLGFLRAGNSIFKLACQASSDTAASIIAKIERERYDDLYHESRIKNGFNAYATSDDDSSTSGQ